MKPGVRKALKHNHDTVFPYFGIYYVYYINELNEFIVSDYVDDLYRNCIYLGCKWYYMDYIGEY